MKKVILLIILSVVSFEILAQQSSSTQKEDENYIPNLAKEIGNIKLNLDTISENYYVISGEGVAGNIGVFVGENDVYLVDNQWSALVPRIKDIINSITDKPIGLIVNTHFHFDHSNGNVLFRKEGVPIIAHANARQRMTQRQVLRGFGSVVQKPYPAEVLPNLTFIDKIEYYDGEEVIELKYYPNAHTDGDVIVHFKQADIYYTGDVFVTYGIPVIDPDGGGDIYALIETIDFLISNSKETSKFIPGHGPVSTKKELIIFSKLLHSILTNVEESVNKDKDLVQTIAFTKSKISEDVGGIDKDQFITLVYEMVIKREN
ncbi:MAG: MBL fold metallo-hydrolase [Maribacter sp.]|uniref:MBL fold metallo-hydrolase n=1 Tax=Maribacter sp. TaxID=1897614 RepID=UPI003298780D